MQLIRVTQEILPMQTKWHWKLPEVPFPNTKSSKIFSILKYIITFVNLFTMRFYNHTYNYRSFILGMQPHMTGKTQLALEIAKKFHFPVPRVQKSFLF